MSRGSRGGGVWAQGAHTRPWCLPGLSKRLCLRDATRWGSGDGGGGGGQRLGASLGPFQGQREPKLGHCSPRHPCVIPCQRHHQLQRRPAAFGTQPGHGTGMWPAPQPALGAGSPPRDGGSSVWALQEPLWKRQAGLGLRWSWEFGAGSGVPRAPPLGRVTVPCLASGCSTSRGRGQHNVSLWAAVPGSPVTRLGGECHPAVPSANWHVWRGGGDPRDG